MIFVSAGDDGKLSGFVQLYPIFTSVGLKRLWLLNDLYVKEEHRKKGIASQVLEALELWAAEINYTYTVLETIKKQPEAIALYQKSGYTVIPNYPPYENVENSVCMKKTL